MLIMLRKRLWGTEVQGLMLIKKKVFESSLKSFLPFIFCDLKKTVSPYVYKYVLMFKLLMDIQTASTFCSSRCLFTLL